MQKFQGKYRIDSARAKWWDYANEGQYFITINSKDFKNIFGNIVNSEMILNDAGIIVAQCWNDLPKHYPNIILDQFCIMPNHVHFIIGVDNSVFLANSINNSNTKETNPKLNPEMNIHGVFEFIKSFKSFSSRKINEMNCVLGVSSWHSRFYDIIIRDENSYNRIKNYILNNPKNWKKDKFFVIN